MAEQIILDTRNRFDAGLMGYDTAMNPHEDGDGLTVYAERASLTVLPSIKLVGPDGEIALYGRMQIEQVIKALRATLGEVG